MWQRIISCGQRARVTTHPQGGMCHCLQGRLPPFIEFVWMKYNVQITKGMNNEVNLGLAVGPMGIPYCSTSIGLDPRVV